MSLTKLSLAGNYKIIPVQEQFGDIPAGVSSSWNYGISDQLPLFHQNRAKLIKRQHKRLDTQWNTCLYKNWFR